MTTIYDINELQNLVERQITIIDMYDKAAEELLDLFLIKLDIFQPLREAYEASQNTHAMTGASEK